MKRPPDWDGHDLGSCSTAVTIDLWPQIKLFGHRFPHGGWVRPFLEPIHFYSLHDPLGSQVSRKEVRRKVRQVVIHLSPARFCSVTPPLRSNNSGAHLRMHVLGRYSSQKATDRCLQGELEGEWWAYLSIFLIISQAGHLSKGRCLNSTTAGAGRKEIWQSIFAFSQLS